MKNLFRIVVVFGLGAALADSACTSACLRETDCGSGEKCISGTCVLIVVTDGATVDGMTGSPSSIPTPTATSTAPAPTSSAPAGTPDAAAPSTPDAAGSFTPEAGYSTDGF